MMKMPYAKLFCLAFMFTLDVVGGMSLDECREKAGYGNSEALYEMGRRYENGDGVRRDPVRAISYYKKSANKRYRPACARMAVIYEKGLYVAKDSVKAAEYEEMAGGVSASQEKTRLSEGSKTTAAGSSGSTSADDVDVAVCRLLGKNGYDKDVATGTVLLFTVAKNGDEKAKKLFVELLDEGVLDPNFKTDKAGWALIDAWRVEQFEKGNRRLGYALGINCKKRDENGKALRYFEAAAAEGNAAAALEAGILYYGARAAGRKSSRAYFCSDEKALRWFKRALQMSKDVKFRNEVKTWLIVLYCCSKMYGDVAEALRLGKELWGSDKRNAEYAYFYAYAGLVQLNDLWRSGVVTSEANYNQQRQYFLGLVREAVRCGQKDWFGILGN